MAKIRSQLQNHFMQCAWCTSTFKSPLVKFNSSLPRMSWLSKFSLYSDSPRLSNQFPTSSTPQYEIMWPGKQSTVKQLWLYIKESEIIILSFIPAYSQLSLFVNAPECVRKTTLWNLVVIVTFPSDLDIVWGLVIKYRRGGRQTGKKSIIKLLSVAHPLVSA